MLKRVPHVGDVVMSVLVWCAVTFVLAIFLWILADLLVHGLSKINFSFLLEADRKSVV